MRKNRLKPLIWLIVLWLAVMQAMAPFIHAHVGADELSRTHGVMHLHTAVPELHHATPALEACHAPHQIIAIAHALQQKEFQLPAIVATLGVILLLLAMLGFSFHPVGAVIALTSDFTYRTPPAQAPPAR